MSFDLERIRKYKEDRGMMANLRCILIDSKKHRAWAVLSRLGINVENKVDAYVAGLYASHPEESTTGNFGDTCRQIDMERGETLASDERGAKLSSTEKRFQLLLNAERSEIFGFVLRMTHMSKAHNIPINYKELAKDLRYWGDRVKLRWAASFWNRKTEQEESEKEE